MTDKKKEVAYVAIEEMKEKRKTPEAIFEGTKAYMKWTKGKQVTEAEYDKAVESFKKAPADGRKGGKR